jgi:hypothetical protein
VFLKGGEFGAADAMYAPIVSRFQSYAIEVGPEPRRYMEEVTALPAWAEWRSEALVLGHAAVGRKQNKLPVSLIICVQRLDDTPPIRVLAEHGLALRALSIVRFSGMILSCSSGNSCWPRGSERRL